MPWGFTLFGQTRIDILDEPRSSNMRVQWQNPIGVSRTIVGNLSGYVEFYDAVSSGPWVGTLDTGLIYQVTPNFSVDVNSFFGLTAALPTTMCLAALAIASSVQSSRLARRLIA